MLAKLLIIPIILVIGFLGWTIFSNKSSTLSNIYYSTPAPTAKTTNFTASENLDNLSIIVPSNFTVKESWNTLKIEANTASIELFRSNTNYDSLKELFDKDEDLRKRKVTYININNLEAAYEIKDKEKAYYIYKDYSIYSISTSNLELYSTLDQIVQSFTLPK